MKITLNADPKDPRYPFMHGNSPMAKEFNKRQKNLLAHALKTKNFPKFDFEQIMTILLEILVDDYNLTHKHGKNSITKAKTEAG